MNNLIEDLMLEATGSVSVHSLLMPWEHGPLAEVFSNNSLTLPTVAQPASLSMPQEASSLEQAQSIAMPPAMGVRVFYRGYVSKLVFPKPADSQADNLHLLAQRYELLIAHDYDASSLGRTIKDEPRDVRIRLVLEALGGKAVSTLRKRLGELLGLVKWCVGEDMQAFPICHQVLLEYTDFLVKSSAPFSRLSGTLESCNFAHFVLGVQLEEGCLRHPIVQGRLRRLRLLRPPRMQARAFTVCEVVCVEDFLEDGCNTLVDRFMVGGILFAVHSRARLGDLKEIRAFKLDFGVTSSDEGFLECVSLSHKSRRYTQATGLCLYLVAPIKGVGGACWGRTWCRVAQQLGIELSSMPDGSALLQSPLASGVLSGRAICATKLMSWLRAILQGSGLSPEHFTGHSAKTTTLSWMAKANVSEATRCVLGHHTPKGTTAVITYSRDEQSGPLRELAVVYRDIRNGRFRPDASRSGMFMSLLRWQGVLIAYQSCQHMCPLFGLSPPKGQLPSLSLPVPWSLPMRKSVSGMISRRLMKARGLFRKQRLMR